MKIHVSEANYRELERMVFESRDKKVKNPSEYVELMVDYLCECHRIQTEHPLETLVLSNEIADVFRYSDIPHELGKSIDNYPLAKYRVKLQEVKEDE